MELPKVRGSRRRKQRFRPITSLLLGEECRHQPISRSMMVSFEIPLILGAANIEDINLGMDKDNEMGSGSGTGSPKENPISHQSPGYQSPPQQSAYGSPKPEIVVRIVNLMKRRRKFQLRRCLK